VKKISIILIIMVINYSSAMAMNPGALEARIQDFLENVIKDNCELESTFLRQYLTDRATFSPKKIKPNVLAKKTSLEIDHFNPREILNFYGRHLDTSLVARIKYHFARIVSECVQAPNDTDAYLAISNELALAILELIPKPSVRL